MHNHKERYQLELHNELDILNESKDIVTKLIAGYAMKEKKKDFWELWYRNAKRYYIRKAGKIKDAIESVEAEIETLEAANAEAQGREGEVPKEEAAPNACGTACDAPEGQACCRSEGACEAEGVVPEVGSSAPEMAAEPTRENPGTGS